MGPGGTAANDALLELGLDEIELVEELDDAFEGERIGRDRDQDLVGGVDGIEGENAQRRGAVEDQVIEKASRGSRPRRRTHSRPQRVQRSRSARLRRRLAGRTHSSPIEIRKFSGRR